MKTLRKISKYWLKEFSIFQNKTKDKNEIINFKLDSSNPFRFI